MIKKKLTIIGEAIGTYDEENYAYKEKRAMTDFFI